MKPDPDATKGLSAHPINRRSFLEGLSVAALAGVATPSRFFAADAQPESDRFGQLLPRRPLGNTGESVTILGLGGQHFRRLPADRLQEAVEASIEGGIRFFDTATNYGRDQLSERLYGEHLVPRYRDEIYLMTKSAKRDAEGARKDLENSLRNMKVDRIDLWQIHTIENVQDVERRWNNGVIDVFVEAQEQGKVRHIGVSGHKMTAAHVRFLDLCEKRGVKMQTMQIPVNVCDPSYDSYIESIMPRCLDSGIAVLAMKTMCGGRLFGGYGERWGSNRDVPAEPIVPDIVEFRDATDYVWSMPISTRIAGFDTVDQLKENIAAARGVRALTEERQRELIRLAASRAGPVMEYYKRDTRKT